MYIHICEYIYYVCDIYIYILLKINSSDAYYLYIYVFWADHLVLESIAVILPGEDYFFYSQHLLVLCIDLKRQGLSPIICFGWYHMCSAHSYV